MQFGWLTLALSPSPAEDAARIHQQIEQVCFAEKLGFSDVWLTEHYFTGESVYCDSLMFAAALAMIGSSLLVGLDRAEGEHRRLATVLLDETHCFLRRALFVRAGGEGQVGSVDGLSIGGDVDLGAGCRHTLDADEDAHVSSSYVHRWGRTAALPTHARR